MWARSAVVLAVALAATWAVAGPAVALEPGVFVDPGSPAGKEYSIPLSVLRGAASGHPAVENQAQPLFGIGITPPAKAGVPVSGGRGDRSGRPQQARTGPVGGSRGSPGRRTTQGASHPGSRPVGRGGTRRPVVAGISTHEGSSTPELALFAALVIGGGLALGALLVAARGRLR
jgi:hypothetical protein